jgi:hypothetical protein
MPTTNQPGEVIVYKSFPTKTLGVDLDSRIIRHYVTTTAVDEDGEVLLPKGADISRFRKSGTVFDVHEYGSKNVVGVNVKWERVEDGIIAETRMSPRPPSLPATVEWWPDSLLWLYHVGDIKGWSIGFSVLEDRQPSKKDVEMFGECRRVLSKYRVFEYSVAPIPCNEDALTLAVKGVVSPRLADVLKTGKRPEKVQSTFIMPGVEAKSEDAPKMGTCSECGKEFAVDDMTDDDGEMVCKECAAKKAAPVEVVATVTLAEPETEPATEVVCYVLPDMPKASIAHTVQTEVRAAVAKARGMIYLID